MTEIGQIERKSREIARLKADFWQLQGAKFGYCQRAL